MKIFLLGATGFIGLHLLYSFRQKGCEVWALVRRPEKASLCPKGIQVLIGDPLSPGHWQDVCAGCDVVINLVGASIFSRWTERRKRLILETRLKSTQRVVEALRRRGYRGVFLNASAIGYYGADRGEEALVEESPAGDDLLAQVCQAWERKALGLAETGVRVCLLRFGVVLGKTGGALSRMLPAFRLGLGGPLGSGKQWFSWIHIKDVLKATHFLIAHHEAQGPFNLVSPHPVRQKELAKTLARVLRRPAFFPLPAFVLRLLLGEAAVFLTGSLKVLPQRLLSMGYEFLFPDLELALRDLR